MNRTVHSSENRALKASAGIAVAAVVWLAVFYGAAHDGSGDGAPLSDPEIDRLVADAPAAAEDSSRTAASASASASVRVSTAAVGECRGAAADDVRFRSLLHEPPALGPDDESDADWAKAAAADILTDTSPDLGPVSGVQLFIIAHAIYTGGVCTLLDSAANFGLSATILGFGGANRGHCVGCGKARQMIPALRRLHRMRPDALALITDAGDVVITGNQSQIIEGWRRMGSPRRAVLSTESDLTFQSWDSKVNASAFSELDGRNATEDEVAAKQSKMFRFPNTGCWVGRPRAVAGGIYAALGDTLGVLDTPEKRKAELSDQQTIIERWEPRRLNRWILLDRFADVVQSVFWFQPNVGNVAIGLWNAGNTPPVACSQFQFPLRNGLYGCCGGPGSQMMRPWPPFNGLTNRSPSVLHYNGPGKRILASSLPGGFPPGLGDRPEAGPCAPQVTTVEPSSGVQEKASPPYRVQPLAEICPKWANRATCSHAMKGRKLVRRRPGRRR